MNKVSVFMLMSLFFAISPLMAQTIMENPTACFGRDCNPAAAVRANKVDDDTCYSVEGHRFISNYDRPDCRGPDNWGRYRINVDFGNTSNASLYSLQEIRNTVATFGPMVRMSIIFTGTYKACPSMNDWLKIGLNVYEPFSISCGKNSGASYKSFGFTIRSMAARFQGNFSGGYNMPELPYADFDLSKCTDDLYLSYTSEEVCDLDIDLLQLVFEQK